MSDRYLWDPSEPEDHAVSEWEHSLRGFAYHPDQKRLRGLEPRFQPKWLAMVATVVVSVSALFLWSSRAPVPAWRFTAIEGTVRVGMRVETQGTLAPGQRLDTHNGGRAQIEVTSIGNVEVQPGSSLRVVRADAAEQRMALERGSIRAVISAPPRVFIVDTPSATAVDLGCSYKLDIDGDGDGFLRVTVGWVSFEAQGRESFIPAGAACRTRKGFPPGTPFYQDASEALQEALRKVDFSGASERAAAIPVVLREARLRDRLTLWHLLTRGSISERAAVYDRFAELAPLPAGITRQGVLAGESDMLDKLWASLELGPTLWWRQWKSTVPLTP